MNEKYVTIKDVEKYLHIYDYSCICCHVQIILSTSASKEVWVILLSFHLRYVHYRLV